MRLKRIDEEKASPKSSSSNGSTRSTTLESRSNVREHPTEIHQDRSSQSSSFSLSSSQILPHPMDEMRLNEVRRKNLDLKRECEELEDTIFRVQSDGNVMKIKAANTVSIYQSKIDSMMQEKEILMEQCSVLQEKFLELQKENVRLQREIMSIDESHLEENP